MSNRSKRAKQFAALGGGVLIAAPLVGSGVAHAAPFEVTNLNDSGAGSLRDAIDQANLATGPDTITFAAGVTGTIALASQLEISDAVTIVGPGAGSLTVSGGDATRVLYVHNLSDIDVTISDISLTHGSSNYGAGIYASGEGNLTLDGVVLSDHEVTAYGGAVYTADQANLTLVDSVVTGNSASYGAGIYAADGTYGDVTIRDSEITNNDADNEGGGLYFQSAATLVIEGSTFSGNTAGGNGGAASISIADGGSATITGSTFSGNSSLYCGGALYFGDTYGDIMIENSTFSGNTALYGGGVYVAGFYSSTDFTIAHSTITLNSSTGTDPGANGYNGGGGIYLSNDGWTDPGSIYLDHTVISGNTSVLPGDDISIYQGGFTALWSMVGNLDGFTLDGVNNLPEGNANLGPLADNGGPTLTHMPLAGSPLINAGFPAFTAPPAEDQRGYARVGGGRIDIGAVESDAPARVIPDTGSSSGMLAALGAALLAVGGALRLVDRRRTRQL